MACTTYSVTLAHRMYRRHDTRHTSDTGLTYSSDDPITQASNADVYISRYSEGARQNVTDWCTNTFAGKQDLNNQTIIDYMSGGALINATLPQATDFEQFYKKQMVSRLVQGLWL